MPLGDRELRRFLKERDVHARLVYPGVPTPTVPAAARALGVEVGLIVKSLLFMADDVPALVIAAGERRVDYRKLAGALAVSRRRLRLAEPAEALEISGFVVGAMPPFGHRRRLTTLIDSLSVPPGQLLYGGGGTREAMLEFSTETLRRVTAGSWLPLTREADVG